MISISNSIYINNVGVVALDGAVSAPTERRSGTAPIKALVQE